MAKSQAAILLIGKQEEAVPFLFSQPQAQILVNTCKVQTTLLTALIKYKQMYLQLARPSEAWKDREKKKKYFNNSNFKCNYFVSLPYLSCYSLNRKFQNQKYLIKYEATWKPFSWHLVELKMSSFYHNTTQFTKLP